MPYLVCDPQTGVKSYKIAGVINAQVPAEVDGSLKLDVSGVSVGQNDLTVSACITDEIWGEACSVPVPFSFTRPSTPTTITGLKLIS
jgi:hypothetical protein